MVTSINDTQIVHIGTGGEFTIAMNVEGNIFVWGRNEFGQVNTERKYMYFKCQEYIKITKAHVITHWANNSLEKQDSFCKLSADINVC